jgi:hypothetical protein
MKARRQRKLGGERLRRDTRARGRTRPVEAAQRGELHGCVWHPEEERGQRAAPETAHALLPRDERQRLAHACVLARAARAGERLQLHLQTDLDNVQRGHHAARRAAGQSARERLCGGAWVVGRAGGWTRCERRSSAKEAAAAR